MASATFIKDAVRTGFVTLLMLGLITSSVLVSGQTTVSGASTMATTMSAGGTAAPMTQASTTTMPGATPAVTVQSTTSSSATASGLSQATTPGATTQSPTTAMQSVMGTTPQSPTTTMQTVMATTLQSATTTMQSVMATTTQSPTMAGAITQPPSMATTSSATTAASGPTSPSSPMASSSGSMMSTMQATTGMADMNGTAMNTSMNMIYCPAFTCNYSDCYSMYMSNNATSCPEDCYCQMLKQTDMCYVASCVALCAESCANSSRTNCSVGCCNSTGCLNETFALMMMMATTTVMPTTTTTTTTVTTTTVTIPTTADNANKCNQGQCTGSTCYTTFANSLQKCSSTDKHCQLKKETVGGNTQWTAGCTTNCSDQTTCKANVQPPCHHECCNATVTSCLFLNGTLNVPSFATRGPHLHTEVIASLLCLLAISFLL